MLANLAGICHEGSSLLLGVLGRLVVAVPRLILPRGVQGARLRACLERLEIVGGLLSQPGGEEMVLPGVCCGEEERRCEDGRV